MQAEFIKPYVLAGKAIFTLYSSKIDKRYTYKVRKDKHCTGRYFVDVLFGQDNTQDYRFLGWFYDGDYDMFSSIKACTTREDIRYRMIDKFLDFVRDEQYPATCVVYPSGRCARCGRLLTTPESIERGLGPECYKR